MDAWLIGYCFAIGFFIERTDKDGRWAKTLFYILLFFAWPLYLGYCIYEKLDK